MFVDTLCVHCWSPYGDLHLCHLVYGEWLSYCQLYHIFFFSFYVNLKESDGNYFYFCLMLNAVWLHMTLRCICMCNKEIMNDFQSKYLNFLWRILLIYIILIYRVCIPYIDCVKYLFSFIISYLNYAVKFLVKIVLYLSFRGLL